MLDVIALRKSYGDLVAVDGVGFRIEPGQTVGLLGPNGAGKSTTVGMIAGLIRPDEGEVRIDGRPIQGDVDPVKGRLGLVPQELAVFDDLHGLHNLEFFQSLYGLRDPSAIRRALEFVGLSDRASDKVKTYSGGMKRRLNLAAALLHDPAILLLDEPTVGVDPQSRNAIFENLTELKRRGTALLYTTHYMEEAERLCDRIVIIDHGKVVADDSPRNLCRVLSQVSILTIEIMGDADADNAVADVRRLEGVRSAARSDGVLKVEVDDLAAGTARVLETLSRSGVGVGHIASERADLETVFLTLTGRSLRDS